MAITNIPTFTTVQENAWYHDAQSHSNYPVFSIKSDSKILLGDYSITASDLAAKLQLLDRLIQEYLPETQI